jgi:hypothetical protein
LQSEIEFDQVPNPREYGKYLELNLQALLSMLISLARYIAEDALIGMMQCALFLVFG